MLRKLFSVAAVVAVVAFAGSVMAQSSRDSINIVGSSTVYPFATVVAEQFGKTTSYKTPTIESTGSGGGFKLFCEGIGVQYPDITNASRAIKSSECETCAKNGVTEIVEVKIGYDGIVLANSKKAQPLKVSRKDIYLALAKEVPNPKGGDGFVANPYETWKDVNSSLPDIKIEVLGPPPTSGTRDAFVELAMMEGGLEIPSIKALKSADSTKFKEITETVREDGAYIEAGENDNLIVQKLDANPDALGIFGFSYLDQNTDKIQGAYVDGVQPNFDAIADGSYSLSRPLFFYVKKAHVNVIPGMKEYLQEFTSEKAWGEDGYLSERGLIPMPAAELKTVKATVDNLTPMPMK